MKRTISVTALILAAAMFAGCGSTGGNNPEVTTSQGETTVADTGYVYPYPAEGYGGENYEHGGYVHDALPDSPR